jgi:integrase
MAKLATKAAVEALTLPDGCRDRVYFDDDLPGFGLRLRNTGARTWLVQYAVAGKTRRVVLGSTALLDPGKARSTAKEILAQVRLGRDPAGEKAEGRVRAAETAAAALQSYMAHQRSRLKPLSYLQVERHLLKHCKPLHALQLAKIDRRAVANRLSAIATKSGPVEANRVRSSLAAFLRWCIDEGMIDSNPAAGATRRPERSRERVLSDAELKAIWSATAGDDDYSAVVRLLMVTGQRLAEIGSLRWSEIIEDWIVLPASRTKNSRQHTIPLVPVAGAILDRPRRPDRDFIFGRRRDRPLSGWSICKAALDERLGAAVAPWVHHDLRRTMATKMAEMNIAPHVIEACLNHVSGHKHGVHGVYNRSDYSAQKRHAFAAWAEHLLAIVEGRATATTVVPLRA